VVLDNIGINAPLINRNVYFTAEPNLDYFKPQYIMVYCDIINPCIVSSHYMKLLSIIPIKSSFKDKNSYHIVEFPNPQYHLLESTLLKK